jgi:hypothetical protein
MDSETEWRLRQEARESEIWRQCVDQIDWIICQNNPIILRLAAIQKQVDMAADKVVQLRRGGEDE